MKKTLCFYTGNTEELRGVSNISVKGSQNIYSKNYYSTLLFLDYFTNTLIDESFADIYLVVPAGLSAMRYVTKNLASIEADVLTDKSITLFPAGQWTHFIKFAGKADANGLSSGTVLDSISLANSTSEGEVL